ncbi:mitochondrial transcription termination factorfamily protein [Striga asiatica]|uniref:Mitochondrial transcription termination factorfamily protein n=1 Tax=Striga asiatica TaxID=4170 RepID=A0A5A7P4A3_STRAF|nr:mitochondrial transcription termination factorfamily protein [Striga asiatica]
MAAPSLLCHHYHHLHPYVITAPYCCPSLRPRLFIFAKPPQSPTKTPISVSVPIFTIYQPKKYSNCSYTASTFPSFDSEAQQQTDDGNRLEEVREAIREYLEQLGVSREDASRISFGCPNYLKMLIDGVQDLDDWNSWSAAAGPGDQGPVQFKNRVYQMAKQKGDKGILPFLESEGLPLSPATRLARYLSSSGSNVLPLLVHKVKYVKEILFSGSLDSEFIGKNARRMMTHLSISVDEDVQQTLAYFEKVRMLAENLMFLIHTLSDDVEARRGGLNLLGSDNTSFRYLIESFPRLFSLPLESRLKVTVKVLEDIGVPNERVRNVLLLFPPILLYDIHKRIKPRLQSFEKIGIRENDISKMLVKYPWIVSPSILENFEEIVDFFDDEKVPRISTASAIKNWPHILGCSVDKIELMVEQFRRMDIRKKKLGQVIAKSPQLLLRKPEEFDQVVSFFNDLGLDEKAISKTLARCPEIFAASIDETLKKKLEFLSSVGISETHLPRVIRKYPELFVCDVDRALYPRVRYLMEVGFSESDIVSMLHRFSPILGYSVEENLKPKLEFLVNNMQRPLSDVVAYPRYFSYSLEKKIRPRYWVLKGKNVEFTLKNMLGINDEEFAAAYLELGEILVLPP